VNPGLARVERGATSGDIANSGAMRSPGRLCAASWFGSESVCLYVCVFVCVCVPFCVM
jgi:hypothetical protein